MKESNYPAVYVQTNEADGNQVIVFRREADGSLSEIGAYPTGGRGDGKPHLTSQGSVVLTGDGSQLLVTNAGSGDVSLFAIGDDGLSLLETVATGPAPKSVAEHDGVVYVLNT
jgi:6-phosphogluconolactonase